MSSIIIFPKIKRPPTKTEDPHYTWLFQCFYDCITKMVYISLRSIKIT